MLEAHHEVVEVLQVEVDEVVSLREVDQVAVGAEQVASEVQQVVGVDLAVQDGEHLEGVEEVVVVGSGVGVVTRLLCVSF